MRQFQLALEGDAWHLTDTRTHRLIGSFENKLEALRQVVYKLKHCPDGGTLTIKLSEELREDDSTSLYQLSLQT